MWWLLMVSNQARRQKLNSEGAIRFWEGAGSPPPSPAPRKNSIPAWKLVYDFLVDVYELYTHRHNVINIGNHISADK